MAAIKAAKASPADRSRLRGKLDSVITLGEYLKVNVNRQSILPRQAREITPRETVVLLRSSKLNENTFLPWLDSHAKPEEFILKPSQSPFMYV